MRQRLVRIDYDTLREVLRLPADCRIVSSADEFATSTLVLKVEIPGVPDESAGRQLTVARPVFYGFDSFKWE
jgi:hypothetical protein